MISSHVPNRLLCRDLKRMGYPQDSYFYYAYGKNEAYHPMARHEPTDTWIAAPLVSEMALFIISKIYPLPEYLSIGWSLHDGKLFHGPMPDAFAVQCIEILKAKEKICQEK